MKKTTEVSDTNWGTAKVVRSEGSVSLGDARSPAGGIHSGPTQYRLTRLLTSGSGPTTSSSMSAPGHALATFVAVPTAHDCAYPDDCTPGDHNARLGDDHNRHGNYFHGSHCSFWSGAS